MSPILAALLALVAGAPALIDSTRRIAEALRLSHQLTDQEWDQFVAASEARMTQPHWQPDAASALPLPSPPSLANRDDAATPPPPMPGPAEDDARGVL